MAHTEWDHECKAKVNKLSLSHTHTQAVIPSSVNLSVSPTEKHTRLCRYTQWVLAMMGQVGRKEEKWWKYLSATHTHTHTHQRQQTTRDELQAIDIVGNSTKGFHCGY